MTRRKSDGETKRAPQSAAARALARRPGYGYDLKIARRDQIEIPEDICLRCFNMQQQFTFPFLVYCEHRRRLAIMHSAHEHTTFECAPKQLEGVLARLAAQNVGKPPNNLSA